MVYHTDDFSTTIQEREQTTFFDKHSVWTITCSLLCTVVGGKHVDDFTITLPHPGFHSSSNTSVSPPSDVPVCSHCALAIQSQEVWWTTGQNTASMEAWVPDTGLELKNCVVLSNTKHTIM